MSIKIEETFQIQAPVDRVWTYLTDPHQVVTCLPGAELTSVEGDSTFLGKVRVKVGPVTVAYSGQVTMTERDEATHVVRMVGEGRESTGTGSAKMTMTSTLVAVAGGTEVRVAADLDVVGKIVQFGRGMIESVNKQLFKQFTQCVRAALEEQQVQGHPPRGHPSEVRGASAAELADLARILPSGPAVGPATGSSVVGGHSPSMASPIGSRESVPVPIVPMVTRALWESVVRLLQRVWELFARLWRRHSSY